MISTILLVIVIILALNALVSYIRRKTAKPNYTNKIVWVTGASSGLGESMAYEFNRVGAYVIISARNTKELQRVKSSCTHPDNVQILPMDIADYKAVQKITASLIERLESNGKRIDVVVENAGTSMISQFVNSSFQNHTRLFDINVHGPFNHIQAIVPHFIKQKGGQIVGVTSLSSKVAMGYRASYNASKSAFLGLLDTIRSELSPYGIKVCNIMPGYIKSNLSRNAFVGTAGEKYGKTTQNNDGGMEADQFAKEAVGAIYNNENEASVVKGWIPTIAVTLRNLSPNLVFFILNQDAKKQRHVFEDQKEA